MGKKSFQKQPKFRLIDQQIALMRNYPESKCYIRRGVLYWEGELCPTALSRTYHATVIYKMGYRPEITIDSDNLIGLDRPDFPHKFRIDPTTHSVKVCLHLPHEFNSSNLIADLIIPWTVEWLYFYEIWLATGEWCGGGVHSMNRS